MTTKVSGTIKLDMNAIRKAVDATARDVLAVGSMILESDLKLQLSTEGQGKQYHRTKSGKKHTASAPGDSPAPDSGTLRNSIAFDLAIGTFSKKSKIGAALQQINNWSEYSRYRFTRPTGNVAALPGRLSKLMIWLEYGTNGPIRPKNAKALKIYAPGHPDANKDGFIFRKWVGGIEPRPFLSEVLHKYYDNDRLARRISKHLIYIGRDKSNG